ncbi:MAG: acyl carrier protein [Alphaproteobacteria bacterium BRH_c36]|nr:MAG: acyl carrier protein [Alphaproteobacteria bacterium BRH_c36]
MGDISERVKKIVAKHLRIAADSVPEKASFANDLGADSHDTIELVMAFEDEFNCEIPLDAAERFQTIEDVIRFLEEKSG